MTQQSTKKRVFSGIQPTGILHLGNYIGAILQWVKHQADNDNIFCVVDLHTLTIPESPTPAVRKQKIREVLGLYLACGIDPKQSAIFVQSHIPELCELAWVLNCVTPVGWLERMTQFKTKSARQESVGTGLLDYPVLQAADILLYHTNLVPVGEDQKQHIELARDIAMRFNRLFGNVFTIPDPMIPKTGARIMGLDDPTAKMSKSTAETKSGHAIGLLDNEKTIRKAIMSAVTDSGSRIGFENASPGVVNLLSIYQSLTNIPRETIEAEFTGQGYGKLKTRVFEAVMETLKPIQERYAEITADPTTLDRIAHDSADHIRPIAQQVMKQVRDATGIG